MKEYITKKGIEKIKQELEDLKEHGRIEVAKRLKEAFTQGDLTENSDYVDAKEAQTTLENKIQELEFRLRNAEVIEEAKTHEQAEMGAKIHLTRSRTRKNLSVRLVSAEEADINSGNISADSPLGRALFGKKIGDNVDVDTPKGVKRYKITRIT